MIDERPPEPDDDSCSCGSGKRVHSTWECDDCRYSLLVKYMDHVGVCEGVDFTDDYSRRESGEHGHDFTDAEWKLLQDLSGETARKGREAECAANPPPPEPDPPGSFRARPGEPVSATNPRFEGLTMVAPSFPWELLAGGSAISTRLVADGIDELVARHKAETYSIPVELDGVIEFTAEELEGITSLHVEWAPGEPRVLVGTHISGERRVLWRGDDG